MEFAKYVRRFAAGPTSYYPMVVRVPSVMRNYITRLGNQYGASGAAVVRAVFAALRAGKAVAIIDGEVVIGEVDKLVP